MSDDMFTQFSNHKVDWLVEKMSAAGFPVSAMYGKMTQKKSASKANMKEFKGGKS